MTKITNSNPNAVSNFEGEGKALGKLSNPKIWTATAITAGLAAVVTATVAFTVPAAAVACSFAAIALISVAALLGMTALALHYICLTKPKSQAGDQPNPDLESSQPQENIPNESARQSSVGTDSSNGGVQNPSSPQKKSKLSVHECFPNLSQGMKHVLTVNNCEDEYRIEILKRFEPKILKKVIKHGNFKAEFLDALSRLNAPVQNELLGFGLNPSVEAMEMLVGFPPEVQLVICREGWIFTDYMEIIQGFSKPAQNAIAGFQNIKMVKLSNKWFLELLASLDDNAKTEVLKREELEKKDLKALLKLPNEVRSEIVNKGWLNKDIINRLPNFDSEILHLLLQLDFDPKQLDMLLNFSKDVQTAILQNDCFSEEKMTLLRNLEPEVQLAIINNNRFDNDRIKLLKDLPANLKVYLIETDQFYDKDIEVLRKYSPEALPIIFANKNFNSKLATALLPFSKTVQRSIVANKFFDENQLRLLAQLDPEVQPTVLTKHDKIAEILSSSGGNGQAIPPNCCLSENFVKLLKEFDETIQIQAIKGSCISLENLKILKEFSPYARSALLYHRFFNPINPETAIQQDAMKDFEAKDVQLLLRHFGPQITSLRLYPHQLSEIGTVDVRGCAKLKFLTIDGIENLSDIMGLEQCANLQDIYIHGGPCPTIVKRFNEIPRKDIAITWSNWAEATECKGPALWEKFAAGGDWHQFFANHPQAKLSGLSPTIDQATNEKRQHFLSFLPNFEYVQMWAGAYLLGTHYRIQPASSSAII